MPTILLINGFRFYFYTGDGTEPAHVHVEKGDGLAKIWLLPEVRHEYFHDFKAQEIKEIMRLTTAHHEFLKLKWNEFFS